MNKINLLLTFCLIWLASVQLSAQQQLSFVFAPATVSADVGDVIDIEVRVGDGFTELIGVQFGLNYNGAALEFVSVDNSSNPLAPNYSIAKRPNQSELINVWTDIFNPTPVTLAPGTLLYTASFNVLSDIGNSIDILCDGDNIPCEFTDNTLEKFDNVVASQTADINGGGAAQNEGPIIVNISNETAATASQSCVQFEVSDFVDILSVQFSIQYDESVLSYSGILQNSSNCTDPNNPPASGVSNPLCLDGSNISLFEPGTLTFSFSDLTSGDSFTLDDGTVIMDLCFDVTGAGGTSSDIVIDDNPTFIQVIKQGEGGENFGLTSNVGSVTVTGDGGALDVVSYSIDNVSGDNGTNVCVPVIADDGFDDILGFNWRVIYDEAILSFTGTQNVNPALGGVGSNEPSPGTLTFIWNAPFALNSEVTLADGEVLYEMCFDVIGSPGQISALEFSNPIGTIKVDGPDADSDADETIVSTTNGNVTVSNSGGFNLIFCEADACAGDQVCVPLLGTGISEIAAFSFTLQYDTDVLDYTNFTSSLMLGVNEPMNNPGNVNVIYINLDPPPAPGSLTLPDCAELGQFCFDVIGDLGESSAIIVGNEPTAFQASKVGDNGFPESTDAAAINGAVNIDCTGGAGSPILACECGAAELLIDEDATIVNNITCNGDQDGSIELSVSGGELPLSFSWSNGQTTQDISDLGPGMYTINITDNEGAMATATFTINEPTVISPNSSAMNTSTQSSNDGSISLDVSGGTAPYTYAWSSGQMTAAITDLSPDTYNVTITDANDCEVITSRTVGTNLEIGPSGGLGSPAGTSIITDVACFGENTGSIDLALIGGVAPLSIMWDFGSDQASLSGLAAGNYCVTIIDTNGDQANACFEINDPASAIDISAAVSPQTIPGANDGSVILTVTGGDAPYTYNWNGPNVNNIDTKDIANLTEGTYTVNITDARGCVQTRSYFVETVGEALTIDSGATQVASISCFGEADGAINAAVFGGATPYTYSWSGPNGYTATSANISGLASGSYQLTVTDANNETAVSVQFFVAEPSAPLSASANITDESAPGQNNGGVVITVSGGTPGYTYNWNNNNFTAENFGLTSGTYTVTVTDTRGCTLVESYVVSTEADPLVIDAQGSTVNGVRCFGDSNGSISPVVNGGLPPYSYNWGPEGNTQDISGLSAGQYNLTVTDQNGTMAIQTFLVPSPTQLDIVVGPVVPESANGNDGSIQVTVSGGTPGYTFAWTNNSGFFSTAEDISGLVEGNYMLLVTDANGCQDQAIVTLGAILSIQNKFETDVDCFGECTGEIDVVVQGGQAPYLYNWAGPNGFSATTQDLGDLCAGTYTITITDNAGQQVFSTCRIDEPLLALTIADNPTIINEIVPNDGSINITVNGGTAPYSYQWSNQATSEDLTGLKAGSYRVTVTDANGCIVISPEYEIERIPLPLRIENVNITDPICNGDCNGAVSLQIVGGDAPYTITFEGQGSQTLSSTNPTFSIDEVCAGIYEFLVVDANGTEASQTIELVDLPAIVINAVLTPELTGMDGAINTTVTGGQAPYAYNWAPSTLPATPDQENLSAGLYIVTVTDANGCEEIESFVIDNEIQPLVIEETPVISQIDCFGDTNGSIDITVTGGVMPYNFAWSDGQDTEDAIGLGAGSYTVTVTDANGDQDISGPHVIDAPTQITADTPITTSNASSDIACDAVMDLENIIGGQAPYEILWASGETTATASQICTGLQGVTITDALGCSEVIEFTPGTDVLINLSVVAADVSDVDCSGDATGSITPAIVGGFAPYNFEWSTGDTTPNIGNLLPGVYSLTVTDEAGTIIIENFIIEEPDPITTTFETTPESAPGQGDGSATVFVEGGVAPYIYQWNNPGSCNTAQCTNLEAGTVFVVIQDAAGCIKVDSTVVGGVPDIDCNMTRNIITPDQDGKNDSFIIQCAPGTINELEIYNRFGQLIFLAENYDNTWEGTDRRGRELPAGGYFYVFLLEDPVTGETIPYQGHITILRE